MKFFSAITFFVCVFVVLTIATMGSAKLREVEVLGDCFIDSSSSSKEDSGENDTLLVVVSKGSIRQTVGTFLGEVNESNSTGSGAFGCFFGVVERGGEQSVRAGDTTADSAAFLSLTVCQSVGVEAELAVAGSAALSSDLSSDVRSDSNVAGCELSVVGGESDVERAGSEEAVVDSAFSKTAPGAASFSAGNNSLTSVAAGAVGAIGAVSATGTAAFSTTDSATGSTTTGGTGSSLTVGVDGTFAVAAGEEAVWLTTSLNFLGVESTALAVSVVETASVAGTSTSKEAVVSVPFNFGKTSSNVTFGGGIGGFASSELDADCAL
ncbi:hypothetical protein GCK72_024904 [Caenorhabditis remanei]|uniref:Uncharacterized protein n=1 Tax=Caenorhabditis remanei TaxID=31234 RepID=A0A6A5G0H8_CAERE|nr:hypothetical protein GCK72_024904 [Caenorhabditis remanei]KAF1748437.1 hypothetical protein GCK72_024904 [Caenorhabditis remanei]